jgi:general secretion pathway protein E
MPNNNQNLLSAQNICQALLNKSLIKSIQAKEILKKKEILKSRLEKQRNRKNASGDRNISSVSIIDVIASLNLECPGPVSRVIDEEIIFQALAEEWKIPFKKIDPLKLDLNLVTTTIPRSFAMKHLVLPIGIKDGILTVGTPNPFNVEVMEDIARASQLKVKVVVSTKSDIVKLINEFFGFKRSITAAELFTYAFDQRASDIHIEPKRDVSLIRMRIDGVLHTVYQLPKNVHSAIISRIKNLSRLDMAEKRKPQDGRIKIDKEGVEIEIRVSTIPVAFGEKVVMRVMDPNILFQDLEKLGFTSTDLIRYNKFINMPHGIVLVCGPTGSGKSTTLYSTLRDLYTPEINITTVEDPIEMVHENFNQIAVQPVIGITFATILRNILRQDPDIIMIGEMRDLETAENAVQAALTGHLVLSTLHTNDAPSSITRLLDLGVPSFLIQSTLVGIMAQRLVRKICNHCMESFEMETEELKAMGLDVGQNGRIKLKRGRGCQRCRGTGYYGRTSIFEVIPYSESLKKMTTANADFKAIAAQAKKEGMITLRENALIKLLAGQTTYQEVLRVTWGQS